LALQNNYDLWQLRQVLNVDEIEKLEVTLEM
jgi:plasmid maintenance system antidote protein VapI